MLIQKGNFLFFKLWLACLALLVIGHAQAARNLHAQAAPDAVAAEFYGWYLETLSADQDPLSDRYDTLTGYVARDLAARLVERARRAPPPDNDYFIQAADYRQGWGRNVHAAVVRQGPGAAEVRLTLGKDARSRRTLRLDMVLEGGAWKIRNVALASDELAMSAAGSGISETAASGRQGG